MRTPVSTSPTTGQQVGRWTTHDESEDVRTVQVGAPAAAAPQEPVE